MDSQQHLSNTNIHDQSSSKCNVFVNELLAIYSAEKALNTSLPLMILNAKSLEIVNALTVHLKFTQEHLLRLEKLFISIKQPF